ncbi:hypothetical protein [Bacillus sp. FSL K6-3431]|uniref:hypothetical protein n=1 Tax=Bacillus sp. FSL K6-3431 TaxID=2921500 RepID=UPI0030F576D1
MDAFQANSSIEQILENTNRIKNKTLCTLVDGDWGIGKTNLIQNYFVQDLRYEVIYVSIFGRNSVKEIENTLLMNLIPGFKDAKELGGVSKLLGTFAKDLAEKFAGVNIEDYINSFSIEDIRSSKKDSVKKVICFDDLERKSDSINMKDMLGLIERATVNFDVILIANTKEFEEDELVLFNKYKEKVIDHIIKIDKLNRNILNQILESIDELNKDEVIDVYLENTLGFDSSSEGYLAEKINNLRVFLKYLELTLRAKEHIGVENIDLELLRLCKAVVYDYFFKNKTKKSKSMNFDKFNIYNDLKKLFLFEKLSEDSFKSYISERSEIRRDIKKLYNLYRLNEEELNVLIKEIDEKIRNVEIEYFIDQTSIISLGSALEENGMLKGKRYKELLQIAIDIYTPKENSEYVSIDHTSWNDFDVFGNEIECEIEIKSFIDELNSRCKEKYSTFLNGEINDCIQRKDYDRILNLLNYNEIVEVSQFEDIFYYYFCELEKQYLQETKDKIEKLVQVTKSEVIQNFFVEAASKEKSITNKKKYQHFESVLEMKMYHESQLESISNYLGDNS